MDLPPGMIVIFTNVCDQLKLQKYEDKIGGSNYHKRLSISERLLHNHFVATVPLIFFLKLSFGDLLHSLIL